MIQYLPVSNEQLGRDLSKTLWDLASPPDRRAAGTVTAYYCTVVEDVAGQWYLAIPENMPLPVSPHVTQQQLDAIVTQIEQQEDMLP